MRKSVRPGSRNGAPAKAARPWWLIAEETCPQCEQGYAYEMELRCAECDEAMCPLCAARQEERTVCPRCAHAGEK